MADAAGNIQLKAVVVDALEELRPYAPLKSMMESEGIDFELLNCRTKADVIQRCADAQAIVVHWLGFDRELVASLPRCRVLIRYGAGYEIIDVNAATEFGIMVCNTPFFCVDEVADHAMALLLSLARRLFPLVRNAQAGNWDRDDSGRLDRRTMHRLRDQTLGLIGLGKIGRAVAERARSFGLHILAYDPYLNFGLVAQAGVTQATLEKVLGNADYVSVHVPLTNETRQLVNADRLRLMKPTAFLINLSRGAVIDEAALIEALDRGVIAGAALDVLAQEPPESNNPLLQMEQVIVTPHYGAASAEAIAEQYREVGESIIAVQRRQRPRYLVNSQVIPRA